MSSNMSPYDLVHPWRRGFRPSTGVCPKCGGRFTIWFTGERDQYGNHVYRCDTCGADIASPTFYAWCDHDNSVLEKDTYWTPCIHGACTAFESVGPQNINRCGHFKPAQSEDLDEKMRRAIEESMQSFKEPDPRVQRTDQGSSGMPTELEKMRQERLRKLREDAS